MTSTRALHSAGQRTGSRLGLVEARSAVIQASADIEATPEQVRGWFLSLKEHPERYQAETHSGFVFTNGSFGEIGAHFETRERLAGIDVRLRFELTAVEETRFAFRLLNPPLAVWGAFEIEPADQGHCLLSLLISGESSCAEWILHLPPVRHAVRKQIQREVTHIKSSVEKVKAAPSSSALSGLTTG